MLGSLFTLVHLSTLSHIADGFPHSMNEETES